MADAYRLSVRCDPDDPILGAIVDELTITLKTAKVLLTRRVEALERELVERLEAQRKVRLLGITEETAENQNDHPRS